MAVLRLHARFRPRATIAYYATSERGYVLWDTMCPAVLRSNVLRGNHLLRRYGVSVKNQISTHTARHCTSLLIGPGEDSETLVGSMARWLCAGRVKRQGTPARKWRAVGRIEHSLLGGGRSSTPSDLRPSPALPIIPQKVTVVAKRAKAAPAQQTGVRARE